MADNFLSGVTGYTKVGTTTFSFSKWTAAMKGNAPKVTNFTSQGFQALVAGITSATLTLEGPYNSGNMPLTVLTSYTFHLGFTASGPVELQITAFVTEITPANDVDDHPIIKVTAESSGVFTAAIV